MDYFQDEINKKCRICDASTNDGDFVLLFNEHVEKTYTGELYEELLQINCTEDTSYPFICSGCDLQIKLFKRLKDKAWKRWSKTNEIASEPETSTNSHLETERDESFLVTNCIVYEPEQKEIQNSNNSSQMKLGNNEPVDIHTDNTENSATQTNESLLVVYDLKSLSSQSFDVDYLIEEDISEKENSSSNELNEVPVIAAESPKFDEQKLTETLDMIEQKNKEFQSISNKQLKSNGVDCKDCGLKFSSTRSLKIHRREQHGRSYVCEVCKKFCRNAENLQGHMREHMGLPAFACEVCNKTFKQKMHYQYHMRGHSNKRDFECSECDKSYLSKSDLTMHIKRTHKGERKFVCTFQNCGKRFYFETHLTYHSYVHSEKKNFKCDICAQRFKAPNALAMHMKTIHNSAKRFACSECSKQFRRKHHLELHSAVHAKRTEISNIGESCLLKANIDYLERNTYMEQSHQTKAHKDFQRDSNLQTMSDQSEETEDFLMDSIENCSETDNQNDFILS